MEGMEKIDLSIPLTYQEMQQTYDKKKKYQVIVSNKETTEKQVNEHCRIITADTKKIVFQCYKNMREKGMRNSTTRQINIIVNESRENNKYILPDAEDFEIYVYESDETEGGKSRRKSKKSKKSKKSRKSRKSRK